MQWQGEWQDAVGQEDVLRVPDLRGQFLRGLNSFAADGNGNINDIREDDRQDPDGSKRVAGSYQKDEFREHDHGISFWHRSFMGENGTWSTAQRYAPNNRPELQHPLVQQGAKETRPRNVAVYYYIKIN